MPVVLQRKLHAYPLGVRRLQSLVQVAKACSMCTNDACLRRAGMTLFALEKQLSTGSATCLVVRCLCRLVLEAAGLGPGQKMVC